MAAVIAHDGTVSTATAVASSTLAVVGTAGNAMILTLGMGTKTRTLTSVTDSAANAGWVILFQNSSSTAGSAVIAWNPNLASSITSVTLNFSGTTRVSMGYMDVSGLTGVVDGTPTGANNTVASLAPAQAFTTTNANDFIVATMGTTASGNSVTSIDTFAIETAAQASGGLILESPATVSETATGTYTCTWHLSVSAVNSTAIAAFKVKTSSALDSGALSIAGAGNIAIASTQQGFLAGAFTIPGAGNIAISAASQGILAGALTILGAGNIAISATQLGKFTGALTIPGAGNILLGSNILSSKDLGALSVTGAGSIAVAAADLAHFTGALSIPGAGSIAIASTRQGFLAGALAINGAGTINTAGISSGGNVVVGALSVAGSGLIVVTAAQLAQLLGALSIAGIGDIEAAFAADPNAPIIITRLDDADFDPNFTPYFF